MKTNTKKAPKTDYVTRTQAVRHLQVTLADFRRLCILKGVYPREITGKSKSKLTKGSTKPITAYNRKDIQYLLHEPLLAKFRDHKIFAKKLSRALGRGDTSDARRIDANRPRYTLDHLVRERYPTFIDAVGDLDDALSTLFLFAAMPATDKISYRVTQDAERLTTEWMAYVAREKLLRKVFVSIKGVYYQATVKGQEVRWLVPFKFPQNLPSDIDFKIMLTFLEFYTTLLHFVLFRLYTESDLVYPPPINPVRAKGVGGIGAYILESQKPTQTLPDVAVTGSKKTQKVEIALERARAADDEASGSDEGEDGDEEESNDEALDEFTADGEDGDTLAQPTAGGSESLFSKFTFFVGREVPLDIVEFLILASGGKVISESSLDELIDNEDENASNDAAEAAKKLSLAGVTHQISDRPALTHKVPGRVYVQPQWIFDSINQAKLLPVGAYAPGEPLPPHLSPWGDRGNYDPAVEAIRGEEAVDEDDSDAEDDDEATAVAEVNADEDEDEEDAAAEREQKELQLEAAGVKYSEAPAADGKKRKAKAPKPTAEQEEKDLRKLMMTGKQRKLYERMQYGNNKKEARDEALRKKRRKIEKLKEQQR